MGKWKWMEKIMSLKIGKQNDIVMNLSKWEGNWLVKLEWFTVEDYGFCPMIIINSLNSNSQFVKLRM